MDRRIHKIKRYIRMYPNEWSIAGQVVGWLITMPYSYEFYLEHQTDGWDASFQHPGDSGGQAHASTAPLAIYQAALKAVKEE